MSTQATAADVATRAKGKRIRGGYMVSCPAIGHDDKKPSCKVWDGPDGDVLFHCFGSCDWRDVRDGAEALGWIPAFEPGKPTEPVNIELIEANRRKREAEQLQDQRRQLSKAQYLWSRRQPVAGSIVETYLRKARGYEGPIPPTIGFLPQIKPQYHPSMIAAFGIPDEPEVGELSLRSENVQGVHLTFLKLDGSDKIDDEPKRKMIGSSTGWPIVLAPMNDLLSLSISEGIETGLSVFDATGCGTWAAGTAGRMPDLADKVPAYTDCLTIVGEYDSAGQTHAPELWELMADRGIYSELRFIGGEQNRTAA